MSYTINKAYSELYDIINHLEPELYKKIPKEFIEKIDENRDKKFNVNIDYSKSINDQELLKDTRIILSAIYRDYICSKEKRQELIKNDRIELAKLDKAKREKYNPDDLFKRRKIN